MQTKKEVVALIEPQASNLDPITQKSILSRYAEKHGIRIDRRVGEQVPQAGVAGEPGHRNLLNDIKDGRVERLLVLSDVKYVIPEEVFIECRKANVKVDLIDIQREGGLMH